MTPPLPQGTRTRPQRGGLPPLLDVHEAGIGVIGGELPGVDANSTLLKERF
jgi:hypothetical protein